MLRRPIYRLGIIILFDAPFRKLAAIGRDADGLLATIGWEGTDRYRPLIEVVVLLHEFSDTTHAVEAAILVDV
jgi:hypothetical protein